MFQVFVDRTQVGLDESAHQRTDAYDHEKGGVPLPSGGQQRRQRYAITLLAANAV